MFESTVSRTSQKSCTRTQDCPPSFLRRSSGVLYFHVSALIPQFFMLLSSLKRRKRIHLPRVSPRLGIRFPVHHLSAFLLINSSRSKTENCSSVALPGPSLFKDTTNASLGLASRNS